MVLIVSLDGLACGAIAATAHAIAP